MTPELWERLKPLYNAALETPEEDRDSFISEACGNDNQVRMELIAMLKANGEQTAFSDAPIVNFKDLIGRDDRFSEGDLIWDRFRIVRHLGSGGMGDVYEASDLELGRIALKTIRANVANDPAMLSRFRREVQLARKISGPNVCRIHELFVKTADKKGSYGALLTMEFLDGVTLADKLSKSGPLPWRRRVAGYSSSRNYPSRPEEPKYHAGFSQWDDVCGVDGLRIGEGNLRSSSSNPNGSNRTRLNRWHA